MLVGFFILALESTFNRKTQSTIFHFFDVTNCFFQNRLFFLLIDQVLKPFFTTVALIFLLNTTIVYANEVNQYPIQVQVQLRSYNSVNLGYHLNKDWYFGGMFLGSQQNQPDDSNLYEQEGVKKSASSIDQGSQQAFEIRYTPWNWGGYISLGSIYAKPYKKTTTFDRRQRKIGDHSYDTDLLVESTREATTSFGWGFGYNHVISNGFSFGAGFLFTSQKPEVTVEITQENAVDTISAVDLQKLKNTIEQDEAIANRIFHISFGMNL